MGTRHLITIVKDGEFKLAQYGQWDGYPRGQGAGILTFLKEGNIEALRRNVDLLHFASEKELKKLHRSVGIKSDWINLEQAERLNNAFPTLSRDTGSKVLQMIADGSVIGPDGRIPTNDMVSFAGGWDCEWAYCIDLDSDVLEVYEAGYAESQGPTRFTEAVAAAYAGGDEEPCHVRLVGSYSLDSLPTVEEFVDELTPRDDENDEEPGAGVDEPDGGSPVWSA